VNVPAIDYSTEDAFKVPAWKKIIVFSSGVIVNFLIAWAAFSVIFMIGTPKGVYVGGVVKVLRPKKPDSRRATSFGF
jgi:membrane-associated protease RseP (regulator of RpoE activity)